MDEETGQYFYRARFYDATVGQFISKDPIGFAGGDPNISRYVGNNPLFYIDPFGLCAVEPEGDNDFIPSLEEI